MFGTWDNSVLVEIILGAIDNVVSVELILLSRPRKIGVPP